MTLRTKIYGDALFVYSVEQEQENPDVESVGIASLRTVDLYDGRTYVEGNFEIKPHCPVDEFATVKSLLLSHLSR